MRRLKQSGYIGPVFIAFLLLLLGACGQRGPLYLPEEPAAQNQNPMQSDKQESTKDDAQDSDSGEPSLDSDTPSGHALSFESASLETQAGQEN